ncbi:MAG: DUF1592 domain-containing protein, partial [Planctomycetales bacterium]|nr:DUF1592 domain-containing protein [Planctomycetales bacterium]
ARRVPGKDLRGEKESLRRGARMLYSEGELSLSHRFPRDGEYVLRARAFADQAGPDFARMAFRVDETEAARLEVPAREDGPETYECRARVPAGRRRVSVSFLNDYYKEHDPEPNDRNLGVAWIEIAGPVDPQVLPAVQRRLAASRRPGVEWRPALREALRSFAPRAWRRPVSEDEVSRVLDAVALGTPEGASFERRLRLGLVALLSSPHFVFRVEVHPKPDDPSAVHALSDWELASRLSYFLWSSLPDDALIEEAAKETLHRPARLCAQALRMLRDPRASALAEGFASQWLGIRRLSEAAPDPREFPDYDPPLRDALRAETEMLFEAVLREDLPVWTLVDADFTFVNERLARHYGIPGVRGDRMRRVRVPEGRRAGVLAHASVLTATSTPTRTSPVKRGKWILEALLDSPPPAPPPGLDNLDPPAPGAPPATLRARLEQHRRKGDCASCHARIDPLGFALEGFDAVGRARERDGGAPVDARGTLPDGRTLAGLAGLRDHLRGNPLFLRSLSRNLLVYALGRGLGPADEPAVARLVAAATADPRLSRIVAEIVALPAFRERRGEKPTKEGDF